MSRLSPAEMPLLRVHGLTKDHGGGRGCRDLCFSLWPGEILGVVGESGAGKSTLLDCLGGFAEPDAGTAVYHSRLYGPVEIFALSEARRRRLARSEWGFVHQEARRRLRMSVSAGGNIAERLLAEGERRYETLRAAGDEWMGRLELDPQRIDDAPIAFSGGMRQRLQIARNLVSEPRLLLMDEPTGGLDLSVQARLLDLLRSLVRRLGLSVVLVTHDLGVVRLLCDRVLVMEQGRIVEEGLTDQVLEDPQHPHSQRLVASILPV